MEEKISIIVPIYKVEQYLDRCIRSIIEQTYKNLEIILVDDGSPDSCGDIAENYKLQDKRIKVFHKENGGLSDARNYGLKHVTGSYVIFLDSDDWIKKETVEELIKASIANQADVVQCGFYYEYKDYILYDDRHYNEYSEEIILNTEQAMKELVINERIKNFAWGKLYRYEILKDILFKKGVLFEDVFWAHYVFERAKKYVIIHKPLWYYIQREDSIVARYSPRNLDIIKGMFERHEFLEKKYPSLIAESYKMIFKTMLQHYYIIEKTEKKEWSLYQRELYEYIIRNHQNIKKSLARDLNLRIQLEIFKISPFFNKMMLTLNRINARKNILLKKNTLRKMKKDYEI